MIQERLRPGVEDGGEADPRAEVLGPQGDLAEGFRNGGKEQRVGSLWIAEKQRVKDIGDGEDDVVILDGQQGVLLRLEPARLLEVLALGTVAVTAAVVRDHGGVRRCHTRGCVHPELPFGTR